MNTLSYFFATNYINRNRANIIQVIKSCNALVKNGLKTTLYSPVSKRISMQNIYSYCGLEQSVQVIKIPHFPLLKLISNAIIMFVYLFKDKSDIVYTRNFYFAFLTSLVGRKVVYEAHQNRFIPSYHTYFQKKILKLLSIKKDFYLIVISEALKKYFKEHGITKQMLVCHDGCEITHSETSSKVLTKAKKYDTVAIYAGSLTKMKGLVHIEYLVNHNKNVLFYILGNEKEKCSKKIVERLAQQNNVNLCGYVKNLQVSDYLKLADILLLLPTKKGIYNNVSSPLKLFEYMASGKAILSTNLDSLKEILTNGENAIIAEDSEEDIDRKFKQLLSDVRLREKLGANAKNDALQYSWYERARKIKEYIFK